MIGRIEARLRRWLSRSAWLAALLRLPSSADYDAPGLVLIQIDGLGHDQLQQALAKGEMPFLRELLRREHYRLHSQYSGIPSTTAAYQGELFYGVKAAVPAFSFRDRVSGRLVRMLEPSIAAAVEEVLRERGGEPLLKGGSSYVDNYTGGAAEAHFSPAARGWGPGLREANPLVVLLFVIANLYSFLRIGVLLVLELGLALADFFRGRFSGRELVEELKFIPTRVAVSIVLRELVTIGAKIDISRGVPVIHLNLLGYDEQAHRRGPGSLFAHWTLRGIDDAIARLWRAAQRSARRHYDVWIYSDHGQSAVQPYYVRHGRSLAEAVTMVFDALALPVVSVSELGHFGIQTQRVRQLGGQWVQRLLPVHGMPGGDSEQGGLLVAAQGPVGFIYSTETLSEADSIRVAEALVAQAAVPMVLRTDGPGRAVAWTAAGRFILPQQADRVLGADHPYGTVVAEELVALCHHPNAGDWVVCGWCVYEAPCSFNLERGAHGGVSPEETRAFILVPEDVPLTADDRVLRAGDLRRAALRRLRRGGAPVSQSRRWGANGNLLRVMTYNVHSCIGMDGKLAPERIARIIARYRPDVVALQELDVGRVRTGGMDQAHEIARYLEMSFHFHAALHVEEERYGNAILSHLPLRLIKAGPLPCLPGVESEPRGALWVNVMVNGTELQIFNTHLGLRARERMMQVEALLGPEWLGHPDCHLPVLCGDLNALPVSRVYRRLHARLQDAQTALAGHRPRRTFFTRFPAARIDYIFVDPCLDVTGVEVPDSEQIRVASDHLPLMVEFRVPPGRNGST